LKSEKLLSAIGGIPDKYIEEAVPVQTKVPAFCWQKKMGFAVCFAAAVIAVLFPLCFSKDRVLPSQKTTVSGTPATASQEWSAVSSRKALVNNWLTISVIPSAPTVKTSNIALLMKDFVHMNDSELLHYYGVSLPIEKEFSFLKEQQNASHGIYKNTARGIYYDTNTFSYASADGNRKITVTLAKGKPPLFDLNEIRSHGFPLAQSAYSGVSVTATRCDESSHPAYYAEFTRSGTGYSITAKYPANTEDFAKDQFSALLAALISAENKPNSSK
jgi:hypothetical protein